MAVIHTGHAAEVFDTSLSNNSSMIDDSHAVAHLFYDLQGVRGHEHGYSFRSQGLEDILYEPGAAGVEAHHGLVYDEYSRLMEQGSGHDETLLHAGKMCDTYGLFALPGFEQRICPTSGVLLDQLYWTTMMEVVEEYMNRTGDVPGVYLSGALKGGMEHLYRMNELYSAGEY